LAAHTAVLFIKFPIISKMNLFFIFFAVLVIIIMTLFEDQDLIGFRFVAKAPHFILQIILIFAIFGLKLYFKYLLRQWVKSIGKWDNYNHYVEGDSFRIV